MLMAVFAAGLLLFWESAIGLARRNRPVALDEVRFLSSVAADLRAGASVRSAIVVSAAGEPSLARARRLALAGAPLDQVAVAIEGMPVNGARAAAALRVVARAGGRSAEVFDGLADRAMEAVRLQQEQRALTTQVRFSAAVVGGLPFLSLLVGGTGRIGTLIDAGSSGMLVAAIGIGMQAAGSALVWRMAKR